jgi:gag-polypeptide of LTR copia-type
MSAMPNSQVVNMMAAGKANRNWPNRAKAHLMIAYLKETYEDTSTLSRVGAKRDLESCVMKKDENPKILFEKLVAVQFKYAGNLQANITEDDLVTQAIQALPAVYNSTVASLIKAEQQEGNDVIIAALKKAVSNFFAIATKGKAGLKAKDIEGGLAAIDEMSDKDNLKLLIQETVNTTICEYSIKHQSVGGVPNSGGAGGPGLTVKYPANIQEPKPNVNVTADMMMAIIQATKPSKANQTHRLCCVTTVVIWAPSQQLQERKEL